MCVTVFSLSAPNKALQPTVGQTLPATRARGALQSLALENPASARVVQIRDTLSLEVMRISSAYVDELSKRNDLAALGSESEMRFDAKDSLAPVDGGPPP
jgi:hypothetical protein